jgi:hypothetical protein
MSDVPIRSRVNSEAQKTPTQLRDRVESFEMTVHDSPISNLEMDPKQFDYSSGAKANQLERIDEEMNEKDTDLVSITSRSIKNA